MTRAGDQAGCRRVDARCRRGPLRTALIAHGADRMHAPCFRAGKAVIRAIFSRKGFDSGYGGVPSPIMPDGSLLSLPIPSAAGCPIKLLQHNQMNTADIAAALSKGKVRPTLKVHLDPDLRPTSRPRSAGWRACFGQTGAAQTHLANQGVGAGDVFLFFGWFRHTRMGASGLIYEPKAKGVHALFGWLQVGEVVPVGAGARQLAQQRPWMADHPHIAHARHMSANNTVYVASDRLTLPGLKRPVAGAGVFRQWNPALQLTHPGANRTVWSVPAWMRPNSSGGLATPLTYHGKLDRWRAGPSPDQALVQTVAKGQEFVLHLNGYQQGLQWLAHLLESHA